MTNKKKRWEAIGELRITRLASKRENHELRIKGVIDLLLANRGLKSKETIEEFLNPKLENVTPKSVDIDAKGLSKAIARIQKAIEQKEQIVVFGDYDVDGICGAAILWETLYGMGAEVLPYIPHRIDEGYGLSEKGIENILLTKLFTPNAKPSLIITVDNGIVANKAVEFANSKEIDVIITDHHVPSDTLPNAHAIVHTTKLCGTGVAYLMAKEITNHKSQITNKYQIPEDHLALVALATVADLVPLTGANRTLLYYGLQSLRKTNRIGLLELFKEAALDPATIGVYEIGHAIAPRLNAMGRLEYAMESLRLLCTTNRERAKTLAMLLGQTNRERQGLTIEAASHAVSRIKNQESRIKKLLFASDASYQQGVIGLVAGKLVEEFYRPAIVLSIGEKYSKASARSIHGFNIIEFIRSASEYLVDAGGHPMAAGFTVETAKITLLQEVLEKKADEMLDDEMLKRVLRIDCELPLLLIDNELYQALQQLSPFGMGNAEPTFVSRDVVIRDIRLVGADRKHMKLKIDSGVAKTPQNDGKEFDGIAFGMGERSSEFHIGDMVDIVYTIDENVWNGRASLQLKVRDMQISSAH